MSPATESPRKWGLYGNPKTNGHPGICEFPPWALCSIVEGEGKEHRKYFIECRHVEFRPMVAGCAEKSVPNQPDTFESNVDGTNNLLCQALFKKKTRIVVSWFQVSVCMSGYEYGLEIVQSVWQGSAAPGLLWKDILESLFTTHKAFLGTQKSFQHRGKLYSVGTWVLVPAP